MRIHCLGVLLCLTAASKGTAQTAADSTAIVATAHDYIDGWYEGDAVRMERALHPHLAKRLVYSDKASGHSRLVEVSALDLVQGSKLGYGKIPAEERKDAVTIFDIFGNAAIAKIEATAWVDYLQLIKWDGHWLIINVVWENRPKAP